jgi:hypothetical protein
MCWTKIAIEALFIAIDVRPNIMSTEEKRSAYINYCQIMKYL